MTQYRFYLNQGKPQFTRKLYHATAIPAWWAKPYQWPLGFQPNQTGHGLLYYWSNVLWPIGQLNREVPGERDRHETLSCCINFQVLWPANLTSSLHLPILLAFTPVPAEVRSTLDKNSTAHVSTRPHALQFQPSVFPPSCSWAKISSSKYGVLGTKLNTKILSLIHSLFLPSFDKERPRKTLFGRASDLAEGCAGSAHNPFVG